MTGCWQRLKEGRHRSLCMQHLNYNKRQCGLHAWEVRSGSGMHEWSSPTYVSCVYREACQRTFSCALPPRIAISLHLLAPHPPSDSHKL